MIKVMTYNRYNMVYIGFLYGKIVENHCDDIDHVGSMRMQIITSNDIVKK